MNTNSISFNNAARNWNEALPIGCGRLGAMIYGGALTEVMQLNEDSLWYGGPRDRINPSAREYLPRIRAAINEGRIADAQEMCAFALSGIPETQRHYEPLGNLYILFEGNGEGIEKYERKLDYSNAIATVSFEKDNIAYRREYIADYPDSVIAIHITCTDLDGRPVNAIGFHTQLARGNVSWDFSPYQNQVYRHPGYNDYADDCRNISADVTMMEGCCGGKDSVGYACGIKIVQKGGTLEAIGNSLIVKGASEALIILAADSTFYDKRPADIVVKRLEEVLKAVGEEADKDEAGKVWEALLKRHTADYRRLYDRVSLDLPETQDEIVRLFNFGRYLMIAGSRPGSQPLNLQGIWNNDFNPAWGSKYTININAEMNYWPAGPCDLAECEEPLFDLIERMKPNGRDAAQRMYGCRGFMAHHNTDITGDCAPQDVCLSSTYWVMGAAWLSLHIWEHYLYTSDIDFLKNNYGTMREAALFILDFLVPDPGTGYMVTSPTISPENEYRLPNGEKGVICKGAAMDNQIIRELFEACLSAEEVLAIKADEITAGIRQMLAKIAPTELNANGCIREWNEDYEETEPGHRHISHLFGLYPGHSITEKDPEIWKAARKTIERRLSFGGGHTGWSRAWIINMYARLKDGESALEHMKLLIEKSTLPNLFDNHPPFQIDGNFGFTSGVAELLTQAFLCSEEGGDVSQILPKEWEHGSIEGLRLRDGRKVDFKW